MHTLSVFVVVVVVALLLLLLLLLFPEVTVVERTLKFKSYFFFFVYIWSLTRAAMTRIEYSSHQFPRTASDPLSPKYVIYLIFIEIIFEPAAESTSDDFRLGDNRNSNVLRLRTRSHFTARCGAISYRNTRVNATVGFHLSRLWHNSRISPCGPFKETGRPPRQHSSRAVCESRGGHPELSVLTSLLVSVDVKLY